MAGELSFLEVDGVELANAARTVSYLSRGLQPAVELGRVGYCAILGTELGAGGVDPAVEPAPWYDAAAPHSADFLGLLLLDLPVDIAAARTSAQRTGPRGGASVGAETAGGAEVNAKGWLIARSAAGLAYGRSWVAARLGRDPCSPCALRTIRYREFCPPASSPSLGEWLLYDVGVTGGGIRRLDGDPAGAWEQVEFQLTSQHAARFLRPVVVQPRVPLAPLAASVGVDLIDFAADPFADGRLVCATTLNGGPGGACGGVTSGGRRNAPPVGFRDSWYRVQAGEPARMFDGAVVMQVHTADDKPDMTFQIAARWTNPTTGDGSSRAVLGRIAGVGGSLQQLHALEATLTGGGGFSGQTRASSPAFPMLGGNVTKWLRLSLSGPQVVVDLWDADPYDALGQLRTDIAPIQRTTQTAPLGSPYATMIGTWGLFGLAGATSGTGWVDNLAMRPTECMSFDRWFCEVPPVAVLDVELAPTQPGGAVGALVTLDAIDGQIANAFVEARRGACPAAGDPFARIDVPLLVAGSVLVIDSATSRITYTDPAGAAYDGTGLVELAEGKTVQWIEAAGCDSPICVSAGVSRWCGTHELAGITIERQERSR